MELFFRKTGSGPPMVILHGLYGSSDNWHSIAKEISTHYTVYIPDLRNHGRSPHSDEFSYDIISDDIHELVTSLGMRKFILAGHSMGGKAALKFALKWPEMINSLVIVDISPFGSSETGNAFFRQHSEILDAIISLDLNGLKSRSEADKLLAMSISSEKIRGFIMKNLDRKSDNTFEWKLNAISLKKNLPEIMSGVTGKDLYAESVSGFPVTFVKGEFSEYLVEEEITEIRKVFPSAEIIVVNNTGHWIHSERPDAIIKILSDQLNI